MLHVNTQHNSKEYKGGRKEEKDSIKKRKYLSKKKIWKY